MVAFLVILPPSLALAALLVPRTGVMEHLTVYALLYAVSGMLAMLGWKRKIPRYVTEATILLCLIPFLPIAGILLMESIMRSLL